MISPSLKKDFPIFSKLTRGGKKFIYLDSAATSQKPESVIDAEKQWYEEYNANIHRGVYALSEKATVAYNDSRKIVAQFIGAPDPKTIIFVSGTTEGINLVAQSWVKYNLFSGDTILLTEMEHHANVVPWQLLAKEKHFKIRWWPITKRGKLKPLNKNLLRGVRFIAVTHVSNVLGTINPIASIIRQAHSRNIPILIDAAQSVPHLPVNVSYLDPDFLVFSGHKMLGPTGIGVLYAKTERHPEMRPYQGGGDMIASVSFKKTLFQPVPEKFEAGTQPLAQAFGLAAAIRYLEQYGIKNLAWHQRDLTSYAFKKLSAIPEVEIFGPKPNERIGLIAFRVHGIHAHDLATFFDRYGVCIRAGHHCAQPLHERLGVAATARVSFYLYTTRKDIDSFIAALKDILGQWQRSTKK